MGTSHSARVTLDDYVERVREVGYNMSNRDRRLDQFARGQIAKLDLEDVKVTVAFEDQDAIILQGVNNQKNHVSIENDCYGNPTLQWTKKSVWRSVKTFFITSVSWLKSALITSAPRLARAAVPLAISYFSK